MLVNSPAPVNAIQPADRLDFRPFQRITAGILEVTPTQAILSVDGVPIVARLTNADQAAVLGEQRTAQFLVMKNSSQEIILKLISPGQPASPATNPAQADLVTRILSELNLPPDAEHTLICRALLDAKMPVTAALVKELAGALAELGEWGAADARLAAELKAGGLPLSAESLKLAAQTARPASADMSAFAQKIQLALSKNNLPPDFRFVLEAVDQLLAETTIHPAQPRGEMARALAAQVELAGKSLENILMEQTGQSSPLWPEKSLVLVARFEQMARGLGFHDLADAARQVLEGVHFTQLLNAGKPAEPSMESWLSMPFTIRALGQNREQMDFSARLKIARYPDEEKQLSVDPDNTRMLLQLDIADGRSILVQLAMRSNQVRTDVHVSDESMQEAARLEFGGLKQGIEDLGFKFFEGLVQVAAQGVPPLDETVPVEQDMADYQSIFLEI